MNTVVDVIKEIKSIGQSTPKCERPPKWMEAICCVEEITIQEAKEIVGAIIPFDPMFAGAWLEAVIKNNSDASGGRGKTLTAATYPDKWWPDRTPARLRRVSPGR